MGACPTARTSPTSTRSSPERISSTTAVRSRCRYARRSQLIDAPPEHPGGLLGCLASDGGGLDDGLSDGARAGACVGAVGGGPLVAGDWTRARPAAAIRFPLCGIDWWCSATGEEAIAALSDQG